MEAACASVGVLDAGFTVEPCPTMSRALDKSEGTKKTSNAQRPTSNPELKTSEFTEASEFEIEHSALGVGRFLLSSLDAHHALSHIQKYRPPRQRSRIWSLDNFN